MEPNTNPIDDQQIVDVVIYDIGLVPPHYFMRPEVIDVVRQHVRADIVSRGKAVPAGVRPIFAPKGSLQASLGRFYTARNNVSRAIVAALSEHAWLIALSWFLLSVVIAAVEIIDIWR